MIMEFEEIYEYCLSNFQALNEQQSALELFRSIYSGPTYVDDIAQTLHLIDVEVRDSLAEKIKAKMMDSVNKRISISEHLMYLLRLENAVVILSLLSRQTKVRQGLVCELSTNILDEAIYWATTSLWDTTGFDHLHRVAAAFSRGLPSCLRPAD